MVPSKPALCVTVLAVAMLLAMPAAQAAGRRREVLQSRELQQTLNLTGLLPAILCGSGNVFPSTFTVVKDPLQGLVWLDTTLRRTIASIKAIYCSGLVMDPLCADCTWNFLTATCTACADDTAIGGVKYSLQGGKCGLKLTWEEFTQVNTTTGTRFTTFTSYGGLNFTAVNPVAPGSFDSNVFVLDAPGTEALAPTVFTTIGSAATSPIRAMYLFNASSTTYSLAITPSASTSKTFKVKSLSIYSWRVPGNATFTGSLSGQTVATYVVSVPANAPITVNFPVSFSTLDKLVVSTTVEPTVGPVANILIDDLVYFPKQGMM